MFTCDEFVSKLHRLACQEAFSWNRDYSSFRLHLSEKEIRQLQGEIRVGYDPVRLKEIISQPMLLLQAVLEDALADSKSLLSEADQERVADVRMSLIPRGDVNACCFGPNILSDGYLVGIHTGFFYGTSLLASALVMEVLEGELESLRKDGTPYFTQSKVFLADPSVADYEQAARFQTKFLPKITVHIGAIHAVMLTFVVLHELGHIIHGHVDSGSVKAEMNWRSQRLSGSSDNWDQEFAADEFAMKSFLSNKHEPERAWTNYASVDLLFRWMSCTDQRKESSTHPPAEVRRQRLVYIIQEARGEDPHKHLSYLDKRLAFWQERASLFSGENSL